MSAVFSEIRKLTGLALPVVAAQVGTMLMGIVDSLMVSRLGVEALAAVSLSGAWIAIRGPNMLLAHPAKPDPRPL